MLDSRIRQERRVDRELLVGSGDCRRLNLDDVDVVRSCYHSDAGDDESRESSREDGRSEEVRDEYRDAKDYPERHRYDRLGCV